HGNGTQHIFYEDVSVFYLSLHQYPFYPGTGRLDESGSGKGLGYTMNIPLSAGADDAVYIEKLEDALEQISKRFIPDLILISAGFDACLDDPLGGMRVTDSGFYKMTELVTRFAQHYCSGRIISLLEGGYNLEALALSVYRHLSCLLKH
ncbi:MAG TPA: histone deacetylase, partial [Calditrichaeota bacterium]|nr:histone deacetylase [Calditrichota bacterium]